MKITLYHNPKCSKSRQALALLKSHDVDIEVIEYLKEPLSYKKIEDLLKSLNMTPLALMRKKEAAYKALGLGEHSDKRTLIKAMVEHPILLERPIAVKGKKATIGRPTENILALL